MASPKELVQIVSDEMGIPVETVTVIDRWLADAGLRTKALRGRGITPMSYQDAANLIIAAAHNVNPKDAVDVVQKYRALPAHSVVPDVDSGATFLGEDFGTALAEMLETVPRDKVAFSSNYRDENHMAADVFMHGPKPRAAIHILRNGVWYRFHYGDPFHGGGDLERTVKFSQITLGNVGELIAKEFHK
ncbi:hypothetical protein FHW20_002314 [Ochrobactrum intermedium]|uniref:Uncharacterized protein n=2 Tax=Bacteria TaxID=2 RepID=A0ABR6APK4_9HYPH|nr:hypothetical protein [Brucella intermedia]MBA8851379.1 hypothetical protein [Brucella intermedia]